MSKNDFVANFHEALSIASIFRISRIAGNRQTHVSASVIINLCIFPFLFHVQYSDSPVVISLARDKIRSHMLDVSGRPKWKRYIRNDKIISISYTKMKYFQLEPKFTFFWVICSCEDIVYLKFTCCCEPS